MDGFRKYTVAELKALPPGTIFEHFQLGKCMVCRKNGIKYMVFKKSWPDAWFYNDEYPWTSPMKMLTT